MPFNDLPASLLSAAERGEWASVKAQIQQLLDAVTTDGPLGRELLQFVMEVPLPVDAVVERYRTSTCVDHGDWDGLQRHLSGAPIEALSERELEFVDLARRGLTNKDIAARLSLSPHTIARHLSNARAKLGAANRAEAAAKFEEMHA